MGTPRPVLALSLFGTLLGCGEGTPQEASTDGSTSTGDDPTTIDPSATTTPGTTVTTTTATTADTSGSSTDETNDTGIGTDLGTLPTDGCAAYEVFADELARADASMRADLATAFLAEAMYSDHGLPIRCDGRLVVLAWEQGGGTLTVTGELADWDPEAYAMTPLVDDFGLLVADIAAREPIAPMYKIVQDGTEFFADPLARRHGWDEFGEYSLTDARVDASHHERWPGFSEGVGELEPRDVVVYVPANAFDLGRDLGVLYMHDGQNLFSPDAFFGGWQVGAAMDAAIASGELAPMLVVGIDNTPARFDEYTHTTDDIGAGPIGGRADEYADFVALGLAPFVDDRYPTAPGPARTAVLGSSLGGLVSLYIAWRHPDVFGFAGSMSGTLGWGSMGKSNDRILELYQQQAPSTVWLYLDSGGDGPCPGGSDNYCANVEMRDALEDLGWILGDTLVYEHAPGASHDEAAWAARLPGFLDALAIAMGD